MLPSFSRSVAAAAVAFFAAAVSPVTAATACNNSPTLCSRTYNNITHMGAHGSAFLREGTGSIAAAGNQFKNATDVLDAGLRLLQAQVHNENGTLRLCHTSCSLLDAGTLESWLTKIDTWMNDNANDVVTLLLVNSDEVDASEFGSVFKSSGISDHAYTPSSTGATSDWPTLNNMIQNKTRLVSFITNINTSTTYPYLLPEFDYVFETNYEVATLTGFNCTLDRPSSLTSASSALSSSYMGLANHFKYQSLSSGTDWYIPDVTNIDLVNSANTTEDGELGKHLAECKSEWSGVPTFVLVDMFDNGDVMNATDDMNGISDATGRTAVSASSDSSEASGRDKNAGAIALLAFVAAAIALV